MSPAGGSRSGRGLIGLAALLLGWRAIAFSQSGVSLYIDEAQYWTWAQALDWGYFSKPPGVAALIWLSTALFGDGPLGVKALAMLCYPLAAAFAWATAHRLYDDRVAFWSALAVLTLPMYAWLGMFVSTDALLTFFWIAGLWAYLRALDRDGWGDWLLVGGIAGLGLMSKYTMAAWLGAAFLHLLAFHRTRLTSAKPWVAAGLALLVVAPNLAWNVANDFPTLRHTADITLKKKAAGGLASLLEFWCAQWGAFGPVLGSAFLLLLVQVRQSWRDERLRLLLWFALPLWAVVSAQAFKASANANWAAPAFAPAAIAAVAWLLARQREALLRAAVVIHLAVAGVAYHWPQLLSTVDAKNQAKFDFWSRARGWDALAQQLRPMLAAHPEAVLVAENRTLMAHLLYELRDLSPLAASWNPDGERSDHYKLTTDLTPYVGRDLLFVTQDRLRDSVRRRAAGSTRLATLRVPLMGEATRTLDVFLLHDFQGY